MWSGSIPKRVWWSGTEVDDRTGGLRNGTNRGTRLALNVGNWIKEACDLSRSDNWSTLMMKTGYVFECVLFDMMIGDQQCVLRVLLISKR